MSAELRSLIERYCAGDELDALRGLLREERLPEVMELRGVMCTRDDLQQMLTRLESSNLAAAFLFQNPTLKRFDTLGFGLPPTRMEVGRMAAPALKRPEVIAKFKGSTISITVADPADALGRQREFGPYDISEVTCQAVIDDVRATHPSSLSVSVGADIAGFKPIDLGRCPALVLCAAGVVDSCNATVITAVVPEPEEVNIISPHQRAPANHVDHVASLAKSPSLAAPNDSLPRQRDDTLSACGFIHHSKLVALPLDQRSISTNCEDILSKVAALALVAIHSHDVSKLLQLVRTTIEGTTEGGPQGSKRGKLAFTSAFLDAVQHRRVELQVQLKGRVERLEYSVGAQCASVFEIFENNLDETKRLKGVTIDGWLPLTREKSLAECGAIFSGKATPIVEELIQPTERRIQLAELQKDGLQEFKANGRALKTAFYNGRKVVLKPWDLKKGKSKIQHEVRVADAIGSHRNIVTFLGFIDEPDDNPLNGIVMEFVEVPPRDMGNNTLVDVLRWGIDIAKGLAHMHEKGVLHCDVKVANILIDTSKTAKLCDFDFSTHKDDINKNEDRSDIGLTVDYCAPEQVAEDVYGALGEYTDVFLLGGTLLHLFAGSSTWDRNLKVFQISSLCQNPSAATDFIDKSLAQAQRNRPEEEAEGLFDVIAQCLRIKPAQRITLLELCKSLEELLQRVTSASAA